ncbi:MAG: biotin--[Synergistaceae bacterium]|nr:biotin--[acetyl-CoA-carboxylase] ligase [Synergistaceae bacterium]
MNKEILGILEANRGDFVSGEDLAGVLGVTRAAVWKAINALRKEGHKITGAQNKGYKLENFSDVIRVKGIRANLKPDTKIYKVLYFGTLESTNLKAKSFALIGEAHGTLVIANQQTKGRGRYGHSFVSPPGTGLYMSLILRPKIEISRFQFITIAAAVAVCKAIEDLYENSQDLLKIKWVNDIFFRGKKIAGILTEAVTNFESGEIESVVTGIGINVSTKNFPPEAGEQAGSIFEDEILFGRDQLCAKISDYILDFADDLTNPEIINYYRQHSMLTGKKISYVKENLKHFATVTGIDDSGGLEILNEAGQKEILKSGEVSLIRSN